VEENKWSCILSFLWHIEKRKPYWQKIDQLLPNPWDGTIGLTPKGHKGSLVGVEDSTLFVVEVKCLHLLQFKDLYTQQDEFYCMEIMSHD
jgi:hypothetical protein